MDDSDSELYAHAPSAEDAAALVSKWLEDSDEENEASTAPAPSSNASSSLLTRAQGVGLGAEDLNDLVAQRRLDPTERKMKYRMEASTKWKEQREKEALALAKRIEDDVYDHDSKSIQVSKKRRRAMGKNELVEHYTTAKKKSKPEVTKSASVQDVQIEHVQEENNEVVFDFSASEKPVAEAKQAVTETKSSKSDSKDKSKHKSEKKKSHKHKHKKNTSDK